MLGTARLETFALTHHMFRNSFWLQMRTDKYLIKEGVAEFMQSLCVTAGQGANLYEGSAASSRFNTALVPSNLPLSSGRQSANVTGFPRTTRFFRSESALSMDFPQASQQDGKVTFSEPYRCTPQTSEACRAPR